MARRRTRNTDFSTTKSIGGDLQSAELTDDEIFESNRSLVLALDGHWNVHRWISIQKAMEHEAKGHVGHRIGHDIFTFHGGISRMTGERSTLTTNSIIVLNGAPKRAGRDSPVVNQKALFRRDQHMCGYCAQIFQRGALTRDHIHPKSRGGKDTWTNLVTSCVGCNNVKGDRTPQEAGMELKYVPYVPCKAEAMILMNRMILEDQMELLKSRIKNKDSRVLIPFKAAA